MSKLPLGQPSHVAVLAWLCQLLNPHPLLRHKSHQEVLATPQWDLYSSGGCRARTHLPHTLTQSLQVAGDRGEGGPFCPVISLPLCPERRRQWEGADASGGKAWHPSPVLCCGGKPTVPHHPLPRGWQENETTKQRTLEARAPSRGGISCDKDTICAIWGAAEGHSSSKHPGVSFLQACRRSSRCHYPETTPGDLAPRKSTSPDTAGRARGVWLRPCVFPNRVTGCYSQKDTVLRAHRCPQGRTRRSHTHRLTLCPSWSPESEWRWAWECAL